MSSCPKKKLKKIAKDEEAYKEGNRYKAAYRNEYKWLSCQEKCPNVCEHTEKDQEHHGIYTILLSSQTNAIRKNVERLAVIRSLLKADRMEYYTNFYFQTYTYKKDDAEIRVEKAENNLASMPENWDATKEAWDGAKQICNTYDEEDCCVQCICCPITTGLGALWMGVFGACSVPFDGVSWGVKKGEKRKIRKNKEKLATLEAHMKETGKKWDDHVKSGEKIVREIT